MRKLIINEEQEKQLLKIFSDKFPINNDKVIVVKKFLDDGFKKGMIERIGENGLPEKVSIVAMTASNGDVLRNLYKEQMVDLLVDRFKNMFSNPDEREKFMKQVINDWMDDKIGPFGTLSVNCI